jgi:nucleotide-binding universal stress UspA family protein
VTNSTRVFGSTGSSLQLERSLIMFGRVLVATDLTAVTRASLRTALDLVRHDEGDVLLVHVIRRIPRLPDRELRAFYERLKGDAKLRMHALTTWFTRERGIDIACEIAIGQPARELVRIARTRGADLIVLAHAEGVAAPLGSVSYKVVQQAKCAVLVLKAPAVEKPAVRRRASSPRARR